MRIGIMGGWPPPYGGVSKSVKMRSEIWASQGHEVHVLNFLGKNRHVRTVNGVFVHDIPLRKEVSTVKSALGALHPKYLQFASLLLSSDYSLFYFLASVAGVTRIVEENDLDILHSHHAVGIRSLQANICSQLFGIPYVVTIYGETWYCAERGDERALRKMKLIAEGASRIVVPSEHCKTGVVKYLGISSEQVSVIYDGIDVDRYKPTIDTLPLKERLKIEDEYVVLFVGHLHSRLGSDYLLKAGPMVLDKDVRFIFVGRDFGLKEQLERIASELGIIQNVVFAGEVSENELPMYHCLADVLVAPSSTLSACLSMSAEEAMATGTPVVGFKKGGVPEVIVDGETGYLVEAGNEQMLAERITEILQDAELRKSMGEKARDRALAIFSKYITAAKLIGLYREVLERS